MMLIVLSLLIAVDLSLSKEAESINTQAFPDDFIFGTASSAYQTEGAWNEDGKGENIWDRLTHTHPEKIADGSNGDIACDSYHKYKEDVALLKKLGVDAYRFSLSWARILPSGSPNKVNPVGITYYNNLIDELLANNITPIVTMFHWDLPVSFQHLGGFANPLVVEWFVAYAKVVFENFGDRVKVWATFNEPRILCVYGYGLGILAPAIESSGIGDYICAHHLIKAHARAYHLYNQTFRSQQNGRVGIVTDCQWYEPASNATEDIEAAERQLQFDCGLYANPIFNKNGDYPEVVKEFVAKRSKAEGFTRSRLPTFTSEEILYIKGTYDFFGLNHYSTLLAEDKKADLIGDPSQEKDARTNIWQDPNWPDSNYKFFKIVPWGLRKVLKWLNNNYDNPVIYITENGYAGDEELHDKERINYHTVYLSNILDSIHKDKVQVKGYMVWSFLDYFEWMSGYTLSFGLYHVNFSDPQRARTAKDSAKFYSEVIKNRKLKHIEH